MSVRKLLRKFSQKSLLHDDKTMVWDCSYNTRFGLQKTVALLDTSIDWTRQEFATVDFVQRHFDPSKSLISNTHGTVCALLLVGSGGIIPEARLMVANTVGGNIKALANGLEWAANDGASIAIVPNGRYNSSVYLSDVISDVVSGGCQVFCAAGNRGEECLLYPASDPNTIAVSARDIKGYALSWCCTPKLANVTTLGVVENPIDKGCPFSGSSVATVIAGGLAALS